MMRNMVTSLLEHEKVTTTITRAKELRRDVERVITMAKTDDLSSRRLVLKSVHDRKIVAKLFTTIAPRYQDRPGGYTRIIRLNPRVGDNAPMAIIELVEEEFTPKQKKSTPKVEKAKPVVVEEVAEVVVAEPVVEELVEEPVEETAVEDVVAEATEEAEENKSVD
jgi:large subunit ribosomal protein L17